MFELYADKNKLTVTRREMVTSGSVNVYAARFEFSPDWQGLTRKAVFRGSGKTLTVLLDEGGECVIPWEVLTSHGQPLTAGAFGTRDETALPTVWANLGTILEGVPGDSPGTKPPTPDVWQQTVERLDREISGKGDTLDYTEDGRLGLYAGDKLLSAVPVQGGGGEGGTSDHRALSHRDAEGQHPIEAITGLSDRLGKTMTTDNALTVSEILKIMEVT